MRRFAVGLVCIATLLVSCGEDERQALRGYLYFGAGGYLGQFSLATGESNVVASMGEANIRAVAGMSESRVLLVIDAQENQREVRKIAWIDVKTLQVTSLFSGTTVAFLPDIETYVYDTGTRLVAAARSADFATDNIVLEHALNGVTALLPVSGRSLLFELREQGRNVIRHYDGLQFELRELEGLSEQCQLAGAIWLDDQQRLLCPQAGKRMAYLLTDLDGNRAEPFVIPSADTVLQPLHYLAGQGTLILTERRSATFATRATTAVWAYSLVDGSLNELIANQHLGEFVTWLPY